MILTYLLFVLTSVSSPQANSWHGIVPLHSTRAEVERTLGPPTLDSKATDAADYRTENERIFVLYSTGSCDVKPSNGWNAPRGTVIKMSVYPNTKQKISDLKLDERKYDKNPDPEVLDYTYYTDDENGISITVNTIEGVVVSISYWPTSKENYLRCPTQTENVYPISGLLPRKFAQYSNISWDRERKQLVGFARLLRRSPSSQGHIIAYGGRRASRGEAQKLANRAKVYLVKRLGINSQRLVTVDGGHKQASWVELYLVPLGVVPPAPDPTVGPNRLPIVNSPGIRTRRRRVPH